LGVIHRRSNSVAAAGALTEAGGALGGAGGGWEGVRPQAYEDPALAGVLKHELIGEAEGARQYRVRYFEVPPGGRTARERHPHDHGVIIVTGRARVTLGDQEHEVGEGDVVYVAGDELHCFETIGDRPLGFVCVVGPRASP
jgi:quercetin dioxygenase-like cupin family protein